MSASSVSLSTRGKQNAQIRANITELTENRGWTPHHSCLQKGNSTLYKISKTINGQTFSLSIPKPDYLDRTIVCSVSHDENDTSTFMTLYNARKNNTLPESLHSLPFMIREITIFHSESLLLAAEFSEFLAANKNRTTSNTKTKTDIDLKEKDMISFWEPIYPDAESPALHNMLCVPAWLKETEGAFLRVFETEYDGAEDGRNTQLLYILPNTNSNVLCFNIPGQTLKAETILEVVSDPNTNETLRTILSSYLCPNLTDQEISLWIKNFIQEHAKEIAPKANP